MMIDPFDPRRFIGYVSRVTPETTQIHFPNSRLLKKFYYDGDVLHGGVVRNFVILEGEDRGFLAKIVSIELPEKERAFLSEAAFQNEDKMHPVGKVEIQLCFEIFGEIKAIKGLDQYPPVGSKVYACSPGLLQNFLKDFGAEDGCGDLLDIAVLPQDQGYPVKISANALFGRHCAIVGTTGGGKSYTIAKLIEEMLKRDGAKIILLDATGEFRDLGDDSNTKGVKIGRNGDCYLSYTNLTESDLFALFRPSGQIQVPTLQKAIKSLKLARALERQGKQAELNGTTYVFPDFYENGMIFKAGKLKHEFNEKYAENIESVESDNVDFEIGKLATQITNECIYENGYNNNASVFGGEHSSQKEHSSSLIMRINARIAKSSFSESFGLSDQAKKYEIISSCGVGGKKAKLSFEKVFFDFYSSPDKKLLKVDIGRLDFEENLREIVTNSIGRYFLEYSQREKMEFRDNPVILFLDEAHQAFRTEKIKDEYSNEFKLDAFERIAKECRKYGLFLCLSTQRPRDIPQGVLSQMGTFIAHRLINQFDRDAIENASPEGSKYVLSFLPSLGQGEAILMGVNFPMPINLKIQKVSDANKPNSDTPKLFTTPNKKNVEGEKVNNNV